MADVLQRTETQAISADICIDDPASTTLVAKTAAPVDQNACPSKVYDSESDHEGTRPRMLKASPLPPPPEKQYFLRERKDDMDITTWWDEDQSGNYDPAARERKIARRRRRDQANRDVLKTANDGSNSAQAEKVYSSKCVALQHGSQLIFTISVTSELLRKVAGKIKDNWPAQDHNVLVEDELKENTHAEYGLRRRNGDKEDYKPLSDPLGLETSLFGHPDARGCVGCRVLQNRCSLLDEGVWPCSACVEDGDSCVLITPPIRKASCEQCQIAKAKCSLRDELVQSRHCSRCVDNNTLCISGPAPGYTKPRISYDHTPSKHPIREYVTCTACREQNLNSLDKAVCSLRSHDDQPPCTTCIQNGVACTFEAPMKTEATRTSKARSNNARKRDAPSTITDSGSANAKANDRSFVSEVSHSTKRRRTSRNGVSDTEISSTHPSDSVPESTKLRPFDFYTALCHPITFNCDTSDLQFSDPFRPCDWCRRPDFAIAGHGFKKCLLRTSEDGLRHDEVEGHQSDGYQPSRICTMCTMVRFRIIGCRHERVETESRDSAEARGAEKEEAEAEEKKRCSICLRRAVARCADEHLFDALGVELDPKAEEARGCGLLLCNKCRKVMRENGNDLQRTLRRLGADTGEHVYALRADAELLCIGGLLVRNLGL